jgi:DNA-binding phage protein
MKVTAIIERADDGNYCIYTLQDTGKCGMFGYGDTIKEAKEDYFEAYREYKEMFPDDIPDLQVTFQYDISSFLHSFSKSLGLAGLQRVTGVSRERLGKYLTAQSKPNRATRLKLGAGLRSLGADFQDVSFV